MAVEVCLAAVSSIVSEGAKSLFKPIIQQISYVFKYQSYIDGLKDQVKKLGHKREMVQQPVNHARRQGDEIYEGVRDWLNSVDAFSEEVANPIIDYENGAKKSCFKGLCPNLLSRYKLSKQAEKAAKDADNLVGKGNFSNISYRPAPESPEHKQVKDYEAFDSRIKVFQDVMEALKDDKLNTIGVYGMGGVGKTTLVKQVAKQVVEEKLFDKVLMAEVSQTPDHQKIQDRLALDLGMEFGLNENLSWRADRLRKRLDKEKRVLIILDNVWTKLELDEVGIPSGEVKKERKDEVEFPSGDVEKERKDDQRRCTIILTSRSLDLLCNDMNSQKNFSIDVLAEKEPLQLFEKIVGDLAQKSAFQPIAEKIVEKCGGLPVALSTVANALKNKRLPTWNDALSRLRSSNPNEIHGMDAKVFSSIELSYNFLESNEAKSLFRLCGLHSESHPIQVTSLLRYGMGLGLFNNVYTLEEARNRVHTLIDNLKASCLLLDGDAEDEAKMHDLIHVVATSICTKELMFNIPNVADLEKKMEETIQKGPTAISLPYRDIQELPERLQCPHLELFLLFTKGDRSMEISDLFFEGTKKLKVLSFTGIRFSSLPSSLGRLINLQTLCFDGCQLEDVAIVGQLRKLEILSFRDSDIKHLPLEIGQLTRLRLLDLSNCMRLNVIAPNVISKFSRLEELYMGNSFKVWENVVGGSNASLVELKGLSKLTTLVIHLPDAEIMPQHLVFVELERYRIFIGEVLGWSVKYETSRVMKLGGLERSTLLRNYGMKTLLKRTEDLNLERLKGFQNVVNELDDGEGFPQLKHLYIEDCLEILHIVGSVGRVHRKLFPLLVSLSLYKLINLENICYSQLPEDQSFSNLRIISVHYCDKLKHLFLLSMVKNLLRLQKVEVTRCNNLEMIVGPDTENPTTTLRLEEINAEDGPVQKVTFPSLEELEISSLGIEKLWPDQLQGVSCCQNLTKATVSGCKLLKYMFSYSMVNGLSQLRHLEIKYCDLMEGVVDTTELGRDKGRLIQMVFPRLLYLRLQWLPELTSFANMGHSHSDSVAEFPSLLILEINDCDNMRRFISMSSSEDNIHTETQPHPLFDEKVRLPSLELLSISWVENLRKIWHYQLASNSFSKLKDLQIYRCDNLVNIFPPMVGAPSSLVYLSVSHCEKIEEIIGQIGEEGKENSICFSELKLLELNNLPMLKSFCSEDYTVEFPSLKRAFVRDCRNMKNFPQEALSKVQVTEKEEEELRHWEEKVGFRDIKNLKLSDIPRLREMSHGEALPDNLSLDFFNNLVKLVMDDCTNMSSAIPGYQLRRLNNLITLEVSNSDSLEEVLHLEELNAVEHFGPLFPKLMRLKLIDLQKLKRFCNFTGNIEIPCLWNLDIENCPSMETFVSNCTSNNKEPQEITSEENFLQADIQPLFDEKVVFRRLFKLKLSNLPKVSYLWKENSESDKVFSNLISIEISECSKLQKLVPSSWHLENLTTLKVSKCHGLINLLTRSTSKSLVNLQRMKLADCKMIIEIIQLQVGEEAKDCIVFRNLKYLGLDCLPSLTSFYSSNCTLEFPSLKQVLVRQCPKMKIFSQGVVNTPELNKVRLTEEEEDNDERCWVGNLNDTIQNLFNEMVGIK